MSSRRTFLTGLGSTTIAAGLSGGGTAGSRTSEGSPAVGPSGMPPDLPRTLEPTGADMGSLFPEVRSLAGSAAYPDSFLGGRYASLEAFKEAGRAILFEAFGPEPPAVDPRPELIRRDDLGDCIREKLLFSTTPVFRVPAYVHIPKGLDDPAPAVVDLHSHGGMFLFGKEKVIDFGTNHPVMTAYHARNYGGRPTTTELVKRGYVVITIDALMFGERRLMMDEDLHLGWDRAGYSEEVADRLNRRCREKESTLAKSMAYSGRAWPGIITWDDIRTVDYLLTRPEVDPDRIGCVGVSLGGWRSLMLAGADERIKAACVVGFLSTVRPMLEAHIDTHSWAHFVPGLHEHLDLPDVVSMMAPKPLLVQQCRGDGLFPLEGMRDAVAKVAAVYGKAGVPDRFDGRFYPGGHRFDVAMQDDAFDWFDAHLR